MAPSIPGAIEPVVFNEGTLETVPLYFLHAAGKNRRLKRLALARGGGGHLAVHQQFGLEERRLVEQVVAVDVVSGCLDCQNIFLVPQFPAQIPFIHPVVAVRSPCRSVADKPAVQKDSIEGGAGNPQHDIIGFWILHLGTKSHQQIFFRFQVLRPDRLGGQEGRVIQLLIIRFRRVGCR
ncbi:MAG: hypothetical protein BWY71_01287 [Planctomycetes bacterium ADurb.Bin412]|nr:MAG: hypothetical protein BWY71_01287 [Planctomycetes bacterium ADurb.Bin412]